MEGFLGKLGKLVAMTKRRGFRAITERSLLLRKKWSREGTLSESAAGLYERTDWGEVG